MADLARSQRLANWLRGRGFRLRLFAACVAAVVLIVALATALAVHSADRQMRKQIAASIADNDALIRAVLAKPLAAGDTSELRAQLDILRDAAWRPYLAVLDETGRRVVTASGIGNDAMLPRPDNDANFRDNDTIIDHRAALYVNDRVAGVVQYGISLTPLRESRDALLSDAILAALAGVLLALALFAPFSFWLTRRLGFLAEGGRRLAAGELGTRVPEGRDDEVGAVERAFNHLAASLEARSRENRAVEERYELVLRGTADAIWDWDLVSNRIYYSKRFREILGYDDEQVFRDEFFLHSALHSDDRSRILRAQDAHLIKRQPFDEEYRLRCRDGSYRWVRARGQAQWDDSGRAVRYAGSMVDLTREKQAEEAQRESEQRLYYAVRGSSDGIWDWDRVRDRCYISPRFKELLGYRDDELPNSRETLFEVVHPEDRELVDNAVRDHFALSVPYDIEYRMRRKDGSYRWFRGRGQAVWDDAGNVVRFSGATTDISDQKQAAAEIHALLAEKQALLDNALVGITHLRDSQLASCNRRFEELFGYPPGGMSGFALESLFPTAADFEQTAAEMAVPISRGEPYSVERKLRRRDGSLFWCHLTGRAIDSEQSGRGTIWIFADITAQRASLDELREARDFSDALINSLPGIFYLYDRDGTMLRWNANFRRVVEYRGDAIRHMRYADFIDPADRDAVAEVHGAALGRGEAAVEANLRTGSGQVIPYLLTAVKVVNRGRELVAGAGIDMTDRKRVEAQMRGEAEELEARVNQRTAELQAVNRELEAFSYSVSHDLTAPLRSIDGFSRMLEEDCADIVSDQGRDFIHRIRAATHRMQKLIDDMLALARITRNEMKREPVDLSAMADQIINELRQSQPGRLVEVSIHPDMRVAADPNLLGIAVNNLLRNSWKFTAKHPSARIEVGMTRSAEGTIYFVRDDGAGFDMRYSKKLFVPFQRMHGVKEFEGTGIGLAIVSRVVQRHGGRIWAESEVEKGATFYFTLQ